MVVFDLWKSGRDGRRGCHRRRWQPPVVRL